jgi:hypothetical protein
MTALLRTLLTVTTLSLAVPALAHHGWAGQEPGKFQLSGKVQRDVSHEGPHSTMLIVDDEGQTWELTFAPPSRTQRAGLKPGVIPIGARVTISGHRNRNAKRLEVKTERVTHAGRNYDVYPDRI